MRSGQSVDLPASPLTISELLAIACSAVLLVSLFALPWFGFSLDGEVVPGSTGGAFRWLHGLDLVLLLAATVALVAALLRFAVPVAPGLLLAGIIAGVVATNLTAALMISPPDGGEAVFGGFGGNPAGELVPQRGALIGLAAAIGVVVTNWIGIGRRMEAVAAAKTEEIAPEPAPVAAPDPDPPAKPKRAKPESAKSPATRPKVAKPRASKSKASSPKAIRLKAGKAKAPPTKTKAKAAAPKKRTTASKPKTTRVRKPPRAG